MINTFLYVQDTISRLDGPVLTGIANDRIQSWTRPWPEITMRVRIYTGALNKIIQHSSQDLQMEVVGLLIGRYSLGLLKIADVAGGAQVGTRVSVVLMPEVQANIAEELIGRDRSDYIVGWYHSHPNLGIFMSGTDVRTQLCYQHLFSRAVALVIDPAQVSDTTRVSGILFRVFQVDKRTLEYYELATDVVPDSACARLNSRAR